MRPYFWVFTIPAIRSSIHILKLSIFTFPTFWYHLLASQLLHSLQRILLLHKVPFIIDNLGQVGWTYTISSPTLPVLCLQVLYFSAMFSSFLSFLVDTPKNQILSSVLLENFPTQRLCNLTHVPSHISHRFSDLCSSDISRTPTLSDFFPEVYQTCGDAVPGGFQTHTWSIRSAVRLWFEELRLDQ